MTRRQLYRARRKYNALRRKLQTRGWALRLRRYDYVLALGYRVAGWGKRSRPLIVLPEWDQSDGVPGLE